MESKAGTRRHYARTKTLVIALDQRHHVALVIDHAEVDSVAALRRRFTGRHFAISVTWNDLVGPAPGVALGEHSFDWQLARAGIADVGHKIRISQLFGFDHHMQGRRRIVS